MDAQEVRRNLEETGALLTGHFQLSSGLHSAEYFQCARVLSWPSKAALLGCAIGSFWQDEAVDVVVGPAIGGIVIAHEVARYLGVQCLFTERAEGRMTLRRGFEVESGERVLVVEDVITTGGSVREVVEHLRFCKADVVGVSAIVWRSPDPEALASRRHGFGDLPFRVLLEMSVAAVSPEQCPQCREGKAVVKPGSRVQSSSAANS